MKALILLPLILLTACASKPPAYTVVQPLPAPPPVIYKLKNYDGPEAMEPQEVRQAQKMCIMSKMHPVTNYLSVRTDTVSKVQVPVSVVCEPF